MAEAIKLDQQAVNSQEQDIEVVLAGSAKRHSILQ